MAPQEALNVLRNTKFSVNNEAEEQKCRVYQAAFKTAIEALEKQIPKKPEKNEYNYFICPCCNSDDYSLMHDSNYADRYNYCHNCGQALDWSDRNDS